MTYTVYAKQSADLDKILITAKSAHVAVTVADADESKNVAGKVPTLETPEGAIFETNAIVRFLGRLGNGLFGKTAFEAGLVDQWVDFAATTIDLPAAAWILPIEGTIPNNGLATKKAGEDIKKVFQILDSHLLSRTYLVGNRVTIADIVVATSLVRLFELVLDPTFRSSFVNATRWFTTVVNQANFHAVKGTVTLAEKVAVAAAKKPAKEEKPKQEKPAKQEKQEKPKKKEEENLDDEEEGEKEEKKKNPLDDLPKSTFVLDEWKRVYSNKDTRTEALPWFYQNFDAAGYSVFWSRYKFPEDYSGKPIYQLNNLIGGFFQRLEKLHKYAFGTVNIYGDGDYEIEGVWVVRGPEIPADLKECEDSESYEWNRADLSNPEQKAKFEHFLAWDGELHGKKFNSGKAYK